MSRIDSTLLDETHAARAALARGEQRAARELVGDALALDHRLAKQHRYAQSGSARGTFESISSHDAEAGNLHAVKVTLHAVGKDMAQAMKATTPPPSKQPAPGKAAAARR